jgi:hypothetical protein
VSGTVKLDKTRIGDRPVGESTLSLRSQPRELVVDGTLAGGALVPHARVTFGEGLVANSAAVTLQGRGGETFSMSAAPVGGVWEGRGAGTLDLALVSLATGRFSRIAGQLEVKELVVSRAHHRGEAEFRDAAIEVASLPVQPGAVTGAFAIEDGTVSLRELAGTAGEGTFRLTRPGTLVLTSALCASSIDVPAVELAGVNLTLSKKLKGRVSGPLSVRGGNCAEIPTVAGDLVIEEAKFRGRTSGAPAAPARARAPPVAPPAALRSTRSCGPRPRCT